MKENFFHHIEIKHLGNQPQQKSPETQKNPEKKQGQWQKCENCQEMVLANGNFGKHYNSCRLYSRFFKKSSDGYLYECLKCPEKRLEREKMIQHILGNHIKRKNPQQKSDEHKIKSDLGIKIPPTPDTSTDISAKENIDGQFFKQTSKGYECLKCPAKRSKRLAMRQHVKGQLISKFPFGVIVWTKIPTKNFPGFLP